VNEPTDLQRLAQRLGHQFADLDLLAEAVTHPSTATGRGRRAAGGPKGGPKGGPWARHFDRMEFLGDRVVGLAVADLLYRRYPRAAAGELSRRFNALVRQESLARIAATVALGGYLRLSPGERDSGGANKPAILADACEAVIAALYLDGGMAAVQGFVAATFDTALADAAGADKDAKTAVQEWAAAQGFPPPVYAVTAQRGPPHAPVFVVTANLKPDVEARGEGATKRAAEQAAAQALLERIAKAGAGQ
jgi:ribonuclease-3